MQNDRWIKRDFGVHPVKKRPWLRRLVILLIITGIFYAGYKMQYEPRLDAKNYASFSRLTLTGVEFKIAEYSAADEIERREIIRSLSALWDKFCEIQCPGDHRSTEIQWKMAKVFDYAWVFIQTGKIEAINEVRSRTEDLQRLIDETIEYGNFKRWW